MSSKRSSSVRIALLGAAAFTLAACKDEKVSTNVFPNVEACIAEAQKATSDFTANDCEVNFAKAKDEFARTAPHYATSDICAEEHGGQCTFVQQESGGSGGGFFMPLMMGYMMGNLLSNNSSGGSRSYNPQPLFKTKSGKYATTNGTALSSNRGATVLRPNNFKAAASTVKSKPMTKAMVQQTGGFGRSNTSTSSGRTFGS